MVLTLRGCQPLAKRGGMAVTLTLPTRIKMKLIYLDQFIVSDLADSKSLEWQELRNIFEELVELELIICPLSFEHYLESSSRNNQEALSNDKLMNKLSGGKILALRDFIWVTA